MASNSRAASDVSDGFRNEIRAAVREEVSRILRETTVPSPLGPQVPSNIHPAENLGRASSSSGPTADSVDRTLTFEEFYRRREHERRDHFQKPPKKKAKKEEKSKRVKNVEIRVGLASQSDGVVKARRGKTQTITVNSSANNKEILQKAVAKHTSFDQTFDESVEYVLLYPDFREVVYIPGTEDLFSLEAYKSALCKDYKRLTFYLIPSDDLITDSESDSSENPHLCTYGFVGGCHKGQLSAAVEVIPDDDGDDDEKMFQSCPWNSTELPLA